jgi:hypothetical protein
MFPTPLQSLSEVYSCTGGLFGRKYSLSDGTVLYFSEIKRSGEHSVANTYSPTKQDISSPTQKNHCSFNWKVNQRLVGLLFSARPFQTTRTKLVSLLYYFTYLFPYNSLIEILELTFGTHLFFKYQCYIFHPARQTQGQKSVKQQIITVTVK